MSRPIAVDPHFDVIDESDDWIVVNKAAPLVVHPTKGIDGRDEPTLLGGLDALLSYDLANGARLGLINRLDRETSGVVVVSKTKAAARLLHGEIEHRRVRKNYLAICHGWPEWEQKEVAEPILRAGEVRESEIWLKQCVHPAGKKCVTRFSVNRRIIWRGLQLCVVDAFPLTGRMHQIRVHLSHLGHPILGDKVYGADQGCYLDFIERGWTPDLENRLHFPRHCLHAEMMDFEVVGAVWRARLSGDLRGILGDAESPVGC